MARACGAAVTGPDLTPELLAVAQKRAENEGYGDITWKVGDAEDFHSQTAPSMSSWVRATSLRDAQANTSSITSPPLTVSISSRLW